MIEFSDQLTCRLSAGGTLTVDVDERVLTDRSAGQYESGYWVSDEEGFDFFLSDDGILYALTDDETTWRQSFATRIGYHVPLMRKSRDFERMIEAMAEGTFKCGTVCTCQQVSKPVQGCPLHGHLFTTT